MQQPTFSVVIPLYNRAHLITQTLQSVLNQTYQDFEVIVVDDGSKDNPGPVVAALNDPRIKFISQANAGGSAARNTGIDAAQGRYIAFLDSDDEWLPEHLAQALPHLEAGQGKVATFCQIIVDRGNGVTFIKPPRAQRPNEPFSEYLLCDRGFVQTSGLCIPQQLGKATKFNTTIRFGQDTDFALRLSQCGLSFKLLSPATTIWNDQASPDRVSNNNFLNERIKWIESLKPIITERAYHGTRGWVLAKSYTKQGDFFAAAKLYLTALYKRCYSLKMAIVIFLQVFIDSKNYRKFSDLISSLGIKP